MTTLGITFGIYPLSVAGTPFGLAVGPADDYNKIQLALTDLQGDSKQVYPRTYLIYSKEWESKMLENAERYFEFNLLGDLTIGCGDWTNNDEQEIDLNNWLKFIRQVINKYGSQLNSIQITNEPNLSFMEGSKSYIMQALIEGVIAAKQEAQLLNLPLKIGFGSVPESPASVPHFWTNFAKAVDSTTFIESVDFVGHNFYVDVFEDKPLDLNEITASIEHTLRDLRENLTTVGIPVSVPIRVTENGWPTGMNPVAGIERSYERQSVVLHTVIRTIYDLRMEFNITHYALFGLRDADSSKDDLFHQYGIVRDDYSPKPAYNTFKKLIQVLGL